MWLQVGALLLTSHGLLYLYERLLWLTGGREKAVAKRFVSHLQARLRLMIHTVTGSVRQQIQKVGSGDSKVLTVDQRIVAGAAVLPVTGLLHSGGQCPVSPGRDPPDSPSSGRCVEGQI